MKNVGVLGAAGSVGRYALKYLTDTEKYNVFAFGHKEEKIKGDSFFNNLSKVEWTFGDMQKKENLMEFINGKDVILNAMFCPEDIRIFISEICETKGIPCVDTGIPSCELTKLPEKTLYIYGAGALPGLSAVIGVYAAGNFKEINEYVHITSMDGLFSRGAAYDYLEGVSKDVLEKKASTEIRKDVTIPFIGNNDLRQYQDSETEIVARVTGCKDCRHYIAFGDANIQKAVEHSVLTFPDKPKEAVEQLMLQSQLSYSRSKEHMAFLIEVNGRDINDENKVQSTVVKFTSSPALTGISAGIVTELAVKENVIKGAYCFSQFPETNLYEKYIDDIVARLHSSPEMIMFEEFDLRLDDLNTEMNGEI